MTTETRISGTLTWHLETSPGMMVQFNAPYSEDNDGEITEEEFANFKYALLARFQHILRCIDGYYLFITSMNDRVGSAVFGLAESNPLQFLKFDYDNFSGYERVSLPRPYNSVKLPYVVTKMTNIVNLKEFLTGPPGVRGCGRDIQRLCTGLVNPSDVEHWQKVLFRMESEYLKSERTPSKKRNFLAFISKVGENLFREFRIDADITYAPGCLLSFSDEAKKQAILILFQKRILEVPKYKKHYELLIENIDNLQLFLFGALFASPYTALYRFEIENFAMGYEWTKPRPAHEFSIILGDVAFDDCPLDQLSHIHNIETELEEKKEPLEIKIEYLDKCAEEIETSIEALVVYVSTYVKYFTSKKDSMKVLPYEKSINGLFHALGVMQYREQHVKVNGRDSIHILTIIHHCLDPDIELSLQEVVFLGMWQIGIAVFENLEIKIAYAVNFLETAKRYSEDKTNPKKMRKLYKNIYEAVPKLGKYFRAHTRQHFDSMCLVDLYDQVNDM